MQVVSLIGIVAVAPRTLGYGCSYSPAQTTCKLPTQVCGRHSNTHLCALYSADEQEMCALCSVIVKAVLHLIALLCIHVHE